MPGKLLDDGGAVNFGHEQGDERMAEGVRAGVLDFELLEIGVK